MGKSLTILFFGQLIDKTGASSTELQPVKDSDTLHEELLKKFPLLKQATFIMTVDRKIIRQNTSLRESSEIALLPPFSGG